VATKQQILARHRLPREAVIEAALACGIPPDGMEARHYGGKAWKVELLSPWGWNTHTLPQKALRARQIADRLQAAGLCCAFDVLDTGGLDCVFELV
jgi:hypothetical protein